VLHSRVGAFVGGVDRGVVATVCAVAVPFCKQVKTLSNRTTQRLRSGV